MAALNRGVLHGVDDAERRNDFAGGEDLDLELVVRRCGDTLRNGLGAAENRVEALREARSEPPFDFTRRLRDRGKERRSM
jgi:hypothetical protein